jgi:MFS family permease
MAPTAIRGRVLTMYQAFYSVGSFICFWAAYGTTKSTVITGDWRWKTMTLLQIICPLAIITSLAFAPETPRWLVANGYIDRARAVLSKTRPAEDVEEELESISDAVAYERENMKGISYKFFFTDKSTRWRFFLACMINFGQQVTGQGVRLPSFPSPLISQRVNSP